MLFWFQKLLFVCLFSFLPSLESSPCRGSQYIFRVSRSSQFSFLTSEHGKDPFRNLLFLRKQLESVGSLHLSKSQINRLKVFSFTRHILVKAWSPRNADSTCGMSSEPLPDLGSSCSLYKNKGEVISQPEEGCYDHLFSLSCPTPHCTCKESSGMPQSAVPAITGVRSCAICPVFLTGLNMLAK